MVTHTVVRCVAPYRLLARNRGIPKKGAQDILHYTTAHGNLTKVQREAVPAAPAVSPYTDLALEAHAIAGGSRTNPLPGVETTEEVRGPCQITRVNILDERGEMIMQKARGHYVTIECPALRQRSRTIDHAVTDIFAQEFGALLPADRNELILVVGLGNWNATPDALGPRIVDAVMVTRHLRDYVPPELRGGLRPVAAVAPGVLGLTGIETGEIIQGIVARIRPGLLVAIDALAAQNVQRLLTTIQISDTGISPGSGIGNRRLPINRDTIGIPVIAVGVPTVVHAATLVSNTIDMMLERLGGTAGNYPLPVMDERDRNALVNDVINAKVGYLVVTPKEIDVMIDQMSRIIAGGISRAMHPDITDEDLAKYIG